MSTGHREELLRQLDEALRKVGAQSVLMTDMVARLVGLNSTDLKCLDLLHLAGPTTAGRLAEHIGLTTGAMTAVIDRLERAGFVRRTRDPRDRRRVHVEALPSAVKRIEPLYRRLAAATGELHGSYHDRQLAIVVDYLRKAYELVAEHVAWLQTQPAVRHRPMRPRRLAAPPSTVTPDKRARRRTRSAAAGLNGA